MVFLYLQNQFIGGIKPIVDVGFPDPRQMGISSALSYVMHLINLSMNFLPEILNHRNAIWSICPIILKH